MGERAWAVLATVVVLSSCSSRLDAAHVSFETLIDSPDVVAQDLVSAPGGQLYGRSTNTRVDRFEDGGWTQVWLLTTDGANSFTWVPDRQHEQLLAWAAPFYALSFVPDAGPDATVSPQPAVAPFKGRDAAGRSWFAEPRATQQSDFSVAFLQADADGGAAEHLLVLENGALAQQAPSATLLDDGRFLLITTTGVLELNPLEERVSVRIACTHELFNGGLCTADTRLLAARGGAAFILDPRNGVWRVPVSGEPSLVVKRQEGPFTRRSAYADPLGRVWLATEAGDTRRLWIAEPDVADGWVQLVDRLPQNATLRGYAETPLIVGASASGGLRVVRPVVDGR